MNTPCRAFEIRLTADGAVVATPCTVIAASPAGNVATVEGPDRIKSAVNLLDLAFSPLEAGAAVVSLLAPRAAWSARQPFPGKPPLHSGRARLAGAREQSPA